jgi:hypothetical protein
MDVDEERVELEIRIEDQPPRRVVVPMRAATTISGPTSLP